MDQYPCGFRCQCRRHRGLSRPYQDACENDHSDGPSRGHYSSRCFDGKLNSHLAAHVTNFNNLLVKVYRTFVVWSYSIYVIVIPCLTFVATLSKSKNLISKEQIMTILSASGVSFVKIQHQTNVETSVFTKSVTQWTVAFLLCSFATTVYSTGNQIISSI